MALARVRLAGSQGKSAQELLPEALHSKLRKLFPPRRVTYIAQVLSVDELNVLEDLRDAGIIARIKRMTPGQLKRYDRFVPADKQQQKLYEMTQLHWIKDEEYLLGVRLGRSPTHKELFSDFTARQNGLRFRAYYCMKYPDRVVQRLSPAVQAPQPVPA